MRHWKGLVIGGIVGFMYGRLLGAFFGAWWGMEIERRWFAARHRSQSRPRRGGGVREDVAAEYATLGLRPYASADEVKKAYRRLAKRYHPDTLKAQNLSPGQIAAATEKMIRINEAYRRLTTPTTFPK